MEYDDVLTRNDDGELSVRTVSVTEQSTVVNPNDVYTRDTDGNLAVRVVGNGGGDSHNKGYYATPEALSTAYPTAEAGDFAIVESTDTVWIWDSDTNAWKDSDQKGQVTSVNNQTGEVVITLSDLGGQEELVSGTNIKTIDGNSILGSGNLELSTYLTYPNTWTTNSTTKAFCDDIAADTDAIAGKAYLGEVTFSDLPASMANGEVVVEIMSGTTAQNKIIVLILTSGNTAPYMWKYTYWNGGTNVSGWIGFQQQLTAGNNITINGSTISATDTTYSDMTGATASSAGTSGLVPAPATGDNNKYLKGDGSWGEVEALPSQTGNAGKFLTTDGTDASWSDKPLVNTATDANSITIGGTAATWYGTNIGVGSQVGNAGVAIGYNAQTTSASNVVIGKAAKTTSGTITRNVVIGADAQSKASNGVVIGSDAEIQGSSSISIGYSTGKTSGTANNTVQIGYNSQTSANGAYQFGQGTNSEAGTVCFALNTDGTSAIANWHNYKLLDSDGTIPTARLTKVDTTITLAAANWSSNTQTVNVTGMTETGVVLVSPDPTDQSAYISAGILCTAQAAGTLTFTCDTTPSGDIGVNIVML